MQGVNIEDACKDIRDKWEEIKRDYFQANPGYYLVLTCVYRSPQEQFELFKKGRTMDDDCSWVVTDKAAVVTNVNGLTVGGAHNFFPSRAIDVAVVNNQTGKTTWEDKFYVALGESAKRYGLVWGGDWDGDGDRTDQKLMDAPHIELPDYRSKKWDV